MPGKRAADVKLHSVGVDEKLWTAVQAKAAQRGESVSEVIRTKLREYLAQTDALPPLDPAV